jgi:hypothetical protein
MPWSCVNLAIDDRFDYQVSAECKANWAERTGRAWKNEDDPSTKMLRCPGCNTEQSIQWTTCGQPEDYKGMR